VGEGEARGSLVKLKRGERGGARTSHAGTHALGDAGCAALAVARWARRRGATASILITRFGVGARFVGASLRLPRSRLGRLI
jgi:hypothetical protein